jgi:DNA polymerase-3 subunit epsilon
VADTFVAVDVETANSDLASICQLGVVTFEGGEPKGSWQRYVDPEDYFDPYNVAIHGISEDVVLGSPNFAALLPEFLALVTGRIVLCHTPFDRLALNRAAERYALAAISCTWLDSAKVVRRTWADFSRSGYGLANVAATLGVKFKHHEAAEDARAAGEIFVHAMTHTGMTPSEWLIRVTQPINTETGHGIAREGSLDGPLAGEVVVFTGALSLPRREAADLAAIAGCTVEESVNKRTTLLVVGDQDIRRFAGHEKSSKHRKAEQLISNGQRMRILGEGDFRRLVQLVNEAN